MLWQVTPVQCVRKFYIQGDIFIVWSKNAQEEGTNTKAQENKHHVRKAKKLRKKYSLVISSVIVVTNSSIPQKKSLCN